ncbi:MAG: triose-phosphate isomerase [Alphaproteobacteria bacterium]|nr:triose-phosphate isomerase [Alphaproteobacteria bacterium]
MTRRPLLAGNWKLHLGPGAARSLAAAIAAKVGDVAEVDVAVFPTALAVPAVVEALRGSMIGVGLQWASPHAQGAYTGTNSSVLAREVGCSWLLAGHSEVRRDLAEDDARVRSSVLGGLDAGLLPMVCLGESLEERRADRVEDVITRQLAALYDGLPADRAAVLTLAYEPLWAIGTGETATPDQAQAVHALIRGWLADRFPAFVAAETRVLYGGSVKPSNAAELLAQPDIDGALVGGASLDAESFAAIVNAAR